MLGGRESLSNGERLAMLLAEAVANSRFPLQKRIVWQLRAMPDSDRKDHRDGRAFASCEVRCRGTPSDGSLDRRTLVASMQAPAFVDSAKSRSKSVANHF